MADNALRGVLQDLRQTEARLRYLCRGPAVEAGGYACGELGCALTRCEESVMWLERALRRLPSGEVERTEDERDRLRAALETLRSACVRPWKYDKAFSGLEDLQGREVGVVIAENLLHIIEGALRWPPPAKTGDGGEVPRG